MPLIELTSRSRMKLAAKRRSSDLSGCVAGDPASRRRRRESRSIGITLDQHQRWISTRGRGLREQCDLDCQPATAQNGDQPENYLQAIGDAAMVGARWVIALDDDFARRLLERDAAALKNWQRMTELLKFYDGHREWRAYRPAGKLAVIQSAKDGSLLSGGILDMIAARHTPVRAVPRND